MTFRFPPKIERELEPVRGRWKIRDGGKHLKLFIDDKLVTVFSKGKMVETSRYVVNTRSEIRRYVRSLGGAT